MGVVPALGSTYDAGRTPKITTGLRIYWLTDPGFTCGGAGVWGVASEMVVADELSLTVANVTN